MNMCSLPNIEIATPLLLNILFALTADNRRSHAWGKICSVEPTCTLYSFIGDSGDDNTAVIVGTIAGGCVLLILVILAVIMFKRYNYLEYHIKRNHH